MGIRNAGDPLLARPFLNAERGNRSTVEPVANPPQPGRGIPGLQGGVGISSRSRFFGADAYLISGLECDDPLSVHLLGGFRYLGVDEGLLILESRVPSVPTANFAQNRFDSFAVRNDFYGGELGARIICKQRKWTVEWVGKVGLGSTHQQVLIDGASVLANPSRRQVGGLLALPTNIGDYTRNRFAVAPEGHIKVGFQLTRGLQTHVGYNFLYISSVARPGELVDIIVNQAKVPPGPGTGPGRPAFFFKGTAFWAQGLNFGLEFRY